jgi:RNA polymerase sigma factor for flagellar operon FliA
MRFVKLLKLLAMKFHDLVNQVRPISMLSIDEAATFSNVDKKSILNILEGEKLKQSS